MNIKNKERGHDKQRKKLSWVYRKKKSLQKSKNAQTDSHNDNKQQQNKNARIVVRNLSFKATENDVKKLFEPFGPVIDINLLRNPEGKLIGCGFIQFKRVEDASKAIFNTNKKELLGRPIACDWAIEKSRFCQKLEQMSSNKEETDETKTEILVGSDDEESVAHDTETKKKGVDNKKSQDLKIKRRKELKIKKRKKRARVIIRNLSFQVTEDDLRNHFSEYGTIEEVKILTKEDGKRVGCAFVQFELVQNAAKAIHYANLKPFLGRPIVVDWAVPKTQFGNNIKIEKADDEDVTEIKKEDEENEVDLTDIKDATLKEEDLETSSKSSDSDVEEIKEEIKSEEESLNESDVDSEMEVDVDYKSKDDIKDDMSVDTSIHNGDGTQKHPRVISNDVTEGKTVFLKNIPFSVKNEDLKRHMEEFGPVHYALICMDPLTEHSKGTAFVKFKAVEDAEKCLSAGMDLRIDDQILEAHRALHRNEVEGQKDMKHDRIKDSRNLYLVKEGVILAGSQAAAGVSAADMSKRLQMEQWKSQMLRNLNMFVSRVRLVVHNLPPTFDDTKLRQLFKKYSGPKAIIKEARVMRDLKNIDANGLGKSKEYGFVSFTTHEDALTALRNINNNPKVFAPHKRPIVAFSIENRIMVNAKQRRVQKSRDHNPLWKENHAKRKSEVSEKQPQPANHKRMKNETSSKETDYAGVQSRPGVSKMRSKFNLKTQAELHSKRIRTEKKKMKSTKKMQMQQKEESIKRKENKPKQGKEKFDPDDAHFTKLVNNYKNKLMAAGETRSKWYEGS